MALLYDCPVGTEIADIELANCPENMGQIQRLWVQRKFSSGTTLNKLTVATPGEEPDLEATWTTLMGASDGTKVVATPFVNDPQFEPGEQIEFGSGNQVKDSIPISMGTGFTGFSCTMYQVHQRTITDLKSLDSETLAVYMINEHGQIIGLSEAGLAITSGTPAAPTEFYPIPIYQWFVGDKKGGGFSEPDTNTLTFKFEPNWSDRLHIYTTATTWSALDKTS